jgi:hypothetical protein
MVDIAGITVVAALALFRLRQMLRWVRGEAQFLGITDSVMPGIAYSGQALPIAFRLPDGAEIHAAPRNYMRRLPKVGESVAIRYDPRDPERVEWAACVPVLGIVLLALVAALMSLLWRSLRIAGVTA